LKFDRAGAPLSFRRPLSFAVILACVSTACRAQSATLSETALRSGFAQPPEQARLRCYWWWLNSNTTEATITRDLTEMRAKGYGGVLLVDANGSDQGDNRDVPPGPLFGSPAWVRLYVHALKTAAALHLELTLNITSGWNLGGPDVKPADASKLLTWSRVTVGAKGYAGALPMPPTTNGFYQQIAVLAYPLSHGAPLPGQDGDPRAPIRALAAKTASREMGFSMPRTESLLEDAPAVRGEEDTHLADVLDIGAQVDATGHVRWHPPSGLWEILRIGYTDSDARVSTSSGAWQGLAIDYLDRGAFDTYWDHTVAPLLRDGQPYLKTALKYLATDSWELGGTNWTGRFAEEFRKRRGYDPIHYMPIVLGRIVNDRATSNRFLDDLRRTVGDLVTDHYDHFAERAAAYGLGVQAESGGPHGAPMDALETFRSSAMPQTEYWAESKEHRSTDEDRFFTKEAASAADIYGKPFAAQEGMTSIGPQWSESPAADLKPSFDQAITEGMTRLVWHEFTSSPKAFGLPGNEYFAGTHMNPNVTWWNRSGAFFAYLNRSQYLLQQGHAVDDVLYFYGDEVPNFVRLKRDDPAHVLPGYDYDVTDEDALLRTLKVRDGHLVTPTGNVYQLLAMPQSRRLSLASLERIASYVRQGGVLAGEPPLAPTGILDDGASQRFTSLTQALWSDCGPRPRSYGKGRVFCGTDSRAALGALHLAPDCDDADGQLDYVHRADATRDIYFLRNTTAHPIDKAVSFRIAGKTPQLWNALDGTIAPQRYFTVQDGRTSLPLHLEPYGSVFVVFAPSRERSIAKIAKKGVPITSVSVSAAAPGHLQLENADPGRYDIQFADGKKSQAVVSPSSVQALPARQWSISFQPDRGAPEGQHALADFSSWADSPDPGVRYFSGAATYRTQVAVERKPGARVYLKLTEIHEICTVRINGKSAGTIWAMPYRLDITDALGSGSNVLELEVTNLWPNRLIGDAQPGVRHTYTQTNIRKYTASSPLLPSGLMGPVTLETVPDTKWIDPANATGQ
jgi:hypothetical protein